MAENSEKIEKSGENQDKISEREILKKSEKTRKKIPNIFVKIIFVKSLIFDQNLDFWRENSII